MVSRLQDCSVDLNYNSILPCLAGFIFHDFAPGGQMHSVWILGGSLWEKNNNQHSLSVEH